MPQFPDLNTLTLALAVTIFTICVTNFTIWLQHRSLPGLSYLAGSAGLISLGLTFIGLRGFVPDFMSIVFANFCILTGHLFYVIGFSRFIERRVSFPFLWGMLIVLLLPFFYLYTSDDYYALRVALVSAGVAFYSFTIAYILLSERKRRVSNWLIGGFFGLNGIAFSFSPFLMWLDGFDFGLTPSTILFMQVSRSWAIFSLLMATFGGVLMVAERLRGNLQNKIDDLEEARRREALHLREERNFYAMISHEFRTPLSTIQVSNDFIEMMLRQQNIDVQEEIDRIRRSGAHMDQMIDNLMADNFLETERNFASEDVDLVLMLREICDLQNVSFENRCEDGLEIVGARYLLPIVFNNLIDNAKKYGLNLQAVKVILEHKRDNCLTVCVCDDGPGVPVDERDVIFEKYYRRDCDRHVQGSGLGLYLVKRILDKHNAVVSVDEYAGQNAFIVNFNPLGVPMNEAFTG